MSPTIRHVQSWEALDSRGRPTVAAKVILDDGASGNASVPSGASAGSHEAVELRDGEARYAGRGVRRAVGNVIGLGKSLVGVRPADVDTVIADSDRTPGFATLGANAALAISVASARAAAASAGLSLARHLAGESESLLLPMPMVNIISGGAHAGAMLDVQDFLVIPTGATRFAEAIEWCAAVREAATGVALARGHDRAVLVADEGGLGVPLHTNRDALELLGEAIGAAGFRAGTDVAIAVDVAATHFYDDGRYHLRREHRSLTAPELITELKDWCQRYPIASLEDVLAEDDWDGWRAATETLDVEVVGDDLFVTQAERLAHGIACHVANSVLVKVNQNGVLSGARAVVDLARTAGYRTVVSARSGETEDDWLADLAVGWRAGQIKVGSTHRSERTAKWNRLLELEATELTTFAGPWPDGRPPKDNPA